MPHITPRPRKNDRPDRPTRWKVEWDMPPGPGGKRRRVAETVRGTKRDAKRHMEEREVEITSAGRRYTKPSKQTVAEYMDHWLRTHVDTSLRPSTAKSYRDITRCHVLPHLGQVPLTDLTTQQLQAWLAGLAQPKAKGRVLSPRRVAYIRAVLHSALAEAVRSEIMSVDPLDRTRPPKQAPKRVESFTFEQALAIDEAGRDLPLGILFSFLWRSALRIGEAIGLRWSDLDLEAGTLSVQRAVTEVGGRPVEGPPKTALGLRTISLVPQTVEMLRHHQQAQEVERQVNGPDWNPLGLVFPSVAGTHLLYHNVRRAWMNLLTAADLPSYGMHALRHTCASLMLQAGVGLAEIAAHLGDDPAVVGRVYAHVLEQTKRQAADRFARFLEDASPPSDQPTGGKLAANRLPAPVKE
ncbi:MAG: tyrosine-type recombinase/integrase [Sulfobacillus sp.]